MAYRNYEDIRAQARGRWGHILMALAPAELQGALELAPRHVPCPLHGGQDGFRLFKDYEDNGGGMCNTCGSYPSGFRLLQWLKGWDFPEVLAAVSEVLGGGLPEVRPSAVNGTGKGTKDAKDDPKIRRQLRETWREAVPLQDELAKPARLYLARRGITAAILNTLRCRCHPKLGYWEQGRGKVGSYPALIFPICDPHGQPVTLHRTYLTPEGFKAPVENPKKTMSYPSDRILTGAAVRLGEPEDRTLGVAEGIETALAVREATGQVCWAATSAALLEKVLLPVGVRQVVIWADNDQKKAGQKAALRLAERLVREGRKVKVQIPPGCPPDKKSLDWNDVLLHQGLSGFPKVGWFARGQERASGAM
jgi:putative DNA primase/helicase